MSTLVSRTNMRRAMAGNRTVVDSGCLQLAHGCQHLLDMLGHLDAPPDMAHHAVGVDHESAAFDAGMLLAVHVLFLEHAEGVADGCVRVGDQIKRKFVFCLEILVLLDRIAGYADHGGIERLKIGVVIAEVLAFLRAAGRVVSWIEIKLLVSAYEVHY